jgi:hypothetical protein
MRDAWKDREQVMANLQAALTLANEPDMGTLAYLIERALDRLSNRTNRVSLTHWHESLQVS